MTLGKIVLAIVYTLAVFYFGYKEGWRDGGGKQW